MRKLLMAVSLALLAPACAARQNVNADTSKQSKFIVIDLGSYDGYVIDPRTHTCVLRLSGYKEYAVVPVSCALLKKNVPEAAPHITWDEDVRVSVR